MIFDFFIRVVRCGRTPRQASGPCLGPFTDDEVWNIVMSVIDFNTDRGQRYAPGAHGRVVPMVIAQGPFATGRQLADVIDHELLAERTEDPALVEIRELGT